MLNGPYAAGSGKTGWTEAEVADDEAMVEAKVKVHDCDLGTSTAPKNYETKISNKSRRLRKDTYETRVISKDRCFLCFFGCNSSGSGEACLPYRSYRSLSACIDAQRVSRQT